MPSGSNEPTRPFRAPVTRPPAEPTRFGQDLPPPPPPPPAAATVGSPAQVVRYGPGVPATPSPNQPGLTAEHVWRGGGPGKPPRRPARLRRILGSALTVILLAAAAVVLYLRFHHAPFHVTNVAITSETQNGCGIDLTGKISTNGAPGTISYQWVFRPDPHAPHPLTQTASSGQDAVFVTVAVEGSGRGSASQMVTLQVLGPDRLSVSVPVVLRC